MNLNQIFLANDGSRLRAGWRLLIQTVVMLIGFSCFGIPLIVIYYFLDPASAFTGKLTPALLLLTTLVQTFAFTTSIFLARRFLDKQSIESLGLKINWQALFDLLAGIGVTFIQMGLIYVVMRSLGWLTFKGFAWDVDPLGQVIGNTLTFLFVFILVGWNEELLSRGYHLQTLASGFNLFWGVIISSTVFGFLHIFNPGSSWVAVLGITVAGFYFAFAYLRAKQLWLPIGLHIGWNFFEGVVFGFPVSGLDIYPLSRIDVTGPVLWTGGAFGPEAGLIILPSLVIGGILIYLFTRKRFS